jgi:hypothetical protein
MVRFEKDGRTAYAFWKLNILQQSAECLLTIKHYWNLQIQLTHLQPKRRLAMEFLQHCTHDLHSTYISKIAIQNLDISVNNLQCYKFVVFLPDPTHKEQRGVLPVYDLEKICRLDNSETPRYPEAP